MQFLPKSWKKHKNYLYNNMYSFFFCQLFILLLFSRNRVIRAIENEAFIK